jgi:hypothetical protein
MFCTKQRLILITPLPRPPQADRKLLPQEWNRKLQAIKAKAAEAAKELPPGFLDQFGGEPVCRRRARLPPPCPLPAFLADAAPPALSP